MSVYNKYREINVIALADKSKYVLGELVRDTLTEIGKDNILLDIGYMYDVQFKKYVAMITVKKIKKGE